MSDPVLEAITSAPFSASEFATHVDRLFYAMLALCTLVVLAVTVLALVFCIRYRSTARRDRHIARRPRWIEYLWIGTPLLIFLGFFFWGATLYLNYRQLPRNSLVIHGVAKQWLWKFYHPGGQAEIDALHIPLGRAVELRLASEDVIHSFFVPHFRTKQDVVPGRFTYTWFKATETGVYRLFCAEYCGTSHSEMRGTVTVMAPQEYAAWLARRRPNANLAAAGEALFHEFECSGCHARASGVHAPSLVNLYGRRVHLQGGGSTLADLNYLRDSILLPEKQIVAGFEPIMPSYQGQLSEAQLLKLLAYLQHLDEPPFDTANPSGALP